MEVTAQLNNLRMSPRKVRLVGRAIKGMDAMVAKEQLYFIVKSSSKPFAKLLDSAMANAQNNFGLVKSNLRIKEVIVNEGPKLKRFRPHGFGMTLPIEKKTSRIKVVLEEKVAGLKAEVKSKTAEDQTENIKNTKQPMKTKEKQTTKPEKKESGGIKNFTRRFFRRKAM